MIIAGSLGASSGGSQFNVGTLWIDIGKTGGLMNDFTIVRAINLPVPWPVPQTTRAMQMVQGARTFELWYSSSGWLEAIILENDSEALLAEIKTPPIEIGDEGAGPMVFSATYHDSGRSLVIQIDGKIIEEHSGGVIHLGALVPYNVRPGMTTVDQVQIDKCLRSRKHRLKDYVTQGWTAATRARRDDDLAREMRLLRSSLEALVMGNTDCVVTVSTHLRKMIGKKNGNHLLQDCASFRNLPLLVWRRPPSDYAPPKLGLAYWQNWDALSLVPNRFATQETDIDSWLEDHALRVGGTDLSHIELIQGIANKLGAHSDPLDRDITEALQQIKFNEVDALSMYLSIVALGVLELTDKVLSA